MQLPFKRSCLLSLHTPLPQPLVIHKELLLLLLLLLLLSLGDCTHRMMPMRVERAPLSHWLMPSLDVRVLQELWSMSGRHAVCWGVRCSSSKGHRGLLLGMRPWRARGVSHTLI